MAAPFSKEPVRVVRISSLDCCWRPRSEQRKMNTWLLVTSCILLKRVGSAEGAVQGGNSSAVAISSGTAEEVYGCMCVPKGECKDDTVTAKEKPAKVGALNECGPEQVCCFHLIVRTEKTVETHSFLFPLREAQVALAEKGEFPWQVIVHPKFRSAQIRNVAVLKLREEVATTPTIGRVVLAKAEDGSFVGKQCVVSGWGKNLKRGSLSSVLTKANVSIVEKMACQEILRKTKLGPSFKLDKGSVCVIGEDGAAACQGDDGGPLVCNASSEDRLVLVGLVSYGELHCGQFGVPAVYADVLQSMDFITEATGLPRERFTKA
ncbi:phenoloxidase-activating factor 2 isoform X2 [Rhipicephalus microplus]|uniref:phenoloxidase-activating factor 2 isoform X2 n=1 Tax=Rhipicephalus microplus TaxID=6941 RepID=UPI003F6D827F